MMGQVVGLIAGEGTCPELAKRALLNLGFQVPVAIAPFGNSGFIGSTVKLRLFEVDRMVACFNSHKVDFVVHIGDISLEQEIESSIADASKLTVDTDEWQIFHAPTIELKLELLAQGLSAKELNPVHINELVPEFRIKKEGWIVEPTSGTSEVFEKFARQLEADVAGRIVLYDNPQRLRRTTVYDQSWSEPVSDEARTHHVLDHIRFHKWDKTSGNLRALVKVGAQIGMDCVFQAPVFREDLVHLCNEHEIDLVVLNADHGVFVGQKTVSELSASLGIAIWAMMPPKVGTLE